MRAIARSMSLDKEEEKHKGLQSSVLSLATCR